MKIKINLNKNAEAFFGPCEPEEKENIRIAILYNEQKDLEKVNEEKIPEYTGNTKSVKYKQLKKEHYNIYAQTKEDELIQLFWMRMGENRYTLSFVWAKAHTSDLDQYYDHIYNIDDTRLKLT